MTSSSCLPRSPSGARTRPTSCSARSSAPSPSSKSLASPSECRGDVARRPARADTLGALPAIGYNAARGTKTPRWTTRTVGTVKRAFGLAEDNPGWTLQQIAEALNQEGHTIAQGKPFHRMQVQRILRREGLYGGTYSYSGIAAAGKHAAIL